MAISHSLPLRLNISQLSMNQAELDCLDENNTGMYDENCALILRTSQILLQ